jgi:hypothetical protein
LSEVFRVEKSNKNIYSGFEHSVMYRLNRDNSDDKTKFSILSIDPEEVQRVVKILKEKGYSVCVSLGIMTVQRNKNGF